MAFPAGIVTKTLTVSPGRGMSGGAAASLEVLVSPEHPSTQSITWVATGQPIVSFFRLTRTTPNVSAVIKIPVVDQPGFISAEGSPIQDWYYKITVRYLLDGRKVGVQTVKYIKPYTSDPATMDFDLLPSGDEPKSRGPEGRPGEPGEDGEDGADGRSAYQIAVDNGFQGTEAQWLDSLKGASGADPSLMSYTYTQNTASEVWTFTHNLAFKPNVSVADSAGTIVEGDILYLPGQTIQISFSAPFTGTAYLS